MQNPLTRLKFLLTATNHHGVHSPFIYGYATKCLYAKREYCRGKSHNILFKSVAYFGAKRIGLPAGSENLQAKLQAEFPSVHTEFTGVHTDLSTLKTELPSPEGGFPSRATGPLYSQGQNGPFDILFAHPSQAKTILDRASKENLVHNDTLLLVDAIHGNATLLSLWKKIKNDPKVTVTVNLFHCGAVFFRREQAREHFKIRI
ncbi:MAG TPA: hypothetical protein VFM69_04600 [Pricia sp.]|nr:hypothetical protein [Pricia sp.]